MENKIKKLLKKGKVNVAGNTYVINLNGEFVELIPVGNGDIASASTESGDYQYTHGGKTYKKAVQAAWEIKAYLTEQRKKNADY